MEKRKFSGLGKEGLEFEEAMDLVKDSLTNLDEYVLDILFDILMDMEEVDGSDNNTIVHNRS